MVESIDSKMRPLCAAVSPNLRHGLHRIAARPFVFVSATLTRGEARVPRRRRRRRRDAILLCGGAAIVIT